MNEKMEKALKEFAEKYAAHYSQEYFYRIEDKEFPFEKHYENVKFDKKFFYELVFQNEHFLSYINEERKKLFEKITNEKELEEKVDTFEQQLLRDVTKKYKQYFKEYYKGILDEKMAERKQELEEAIEDEEYYENRRYIGEEEAIGGKVTEEERERMIKEAKDFQTGHQKKLERYLEMKKELE